MKHIILYVFGWLITGYLACNIGALVGYAVFAIVRFVKILKLRRASKYIDQLCYDDAVELFRLQTNLDNTQQVVPTRDIVLKAATKTLSDSTKTKFTAKIVRDSLLILMIWPIACIVLARSTYDDCVNEL